MVQQRHINDRPLNFCLRLRPSSSHPAFLASALHPPEVRARMEKADVAIRSMLPLEHQRRLVRMERSPIGRSDNSCARCPRREPPESHL